MIDEADQSASGAPALAPLITTYQFKAGSAGAVRRVLVTLNAGTDVTAGSRFEARSPEAIASRVNGLSPDSEVLRLLSDQPITRVHAAQAGATGYLVSTVVNVAENRLALWEYTAAENVRQVDVTIGPSPDGGLTLPVSCVALPTTARRRAS